MAKTVKMQDIAEKLGVSTMTVSKALSGKSGVSEQTRQRIKELAEEMGYVLPAGEREGEKRSYNVGVIHTVWQPFTGSFIRRSVPMRFKITAL